MRFETAENVGLSQPQSEPESVDANDRGQRSEGREQWPASNLKEQQDERTNY
jgi:hypothetical protein